MSLFLDLKNVKLLVIFVIHDKQEQYLAVWNTYHVPLRPSWTSFCLLFSLQYLQQDV